MINVKMKCLQPTSKSTAKAPLFLFATLEKSIVLLYPQVWCSPANGAKCLGMNRCTEKYWVLSTLQWETSQPRLI